MSSTKEFGAIHTLVVEIWAQTTCQNRLRPSFSATSPLIPNDLPNIPQALLGGPSVLPGDKSEH